MRLCDGVTFYYPGQEKPAVRKITLEMAPGERIALTGPSGSGKTTLLFLLAGLYSPREGSVHAPEVSMVFQEDRLAPGLTALGQLKLVAPGKSDTALAALLEELGLGGRENERTAEMSGGMRRRVALARAAAFGAPLWLLDEPFTGLDEKNLERAAEFILRCLPADGFLIAALHKAEEAERLNAPLVPLDTLRRRDTG